MNTKKEEITITTERLRQYLGNSYIMGWHMSKTHAKEFDCHQCASDHVDLVMGVLKEASKQKSPQIQNRPKMLYRIFDISEKGHVSPLRTSEFEVGTLNWFDNEKDALDWIDDIFKDENNEDYAYYQLIVLPTFQVKPIKELPD